MKKMYLFISMLLMSIISYAYDFEVDGIKYNIISRENLTVSVAQDDNTCLGDIVIPSTVTYGSYTFNVIEIADYFLFNNSNVSSITIEEGVRKIGNCAIFNQSYRPIDYISYPNSIDTIVFQGVGGGYNPRKIYIKNIKHWCEDVVLTSSYSHPLGRGRLDSSGDNYGFLYIDGILNKNLLIPNNVDHINDGIFNESNIDTLTISSSVKKIGYLAFGESTVKCVKFNIGLDSIASRAFYNTRLNDIILPEGLKYIGEYAFYGCKNALYIQINNEITEINQSAFRGCFSAQKLVLGSGISKIQSNAFADCGQLQQVVSKSLTPPDIETNVFSAGAYLFATLYVPRGTKSLYEAATGWKEFSSIVETEDYDIILNYSCANITVTNGGTIVFNGVSIANTNISINIKENEDVDLQVIPNYSYRLASLTVNGIDVTDNVADGVYTIKNVSSNVDIYASFERHFDVGNLTKVIDFIMNSTASAEDIALYDLNNNKKLDIGDIILIVKFILNNSNNAPNFVSRRVGEVTDLSQYTAAQFEVKTVGNVNIEDIRLVKNMEQTHQLMYQQKDANTYTVVVYSMSNKLMQSENGKIIEIGNNSEILIIENVTVATPTGETAYYHTLSATTDIEQTERENGTAVIYDLKGNRLNDSKSLEKGIFIINGKKIVVR